MPISWALPTEKPPQTANSLPGGYCDCGGGGGGGACERVGSGAPNMARNTSRYWDSRMRAMEDGDLGTGIYSIRQYEERILVDISEIFSGEYRSECARLSPSEKRLRCAMPLQLGGAFTNFGGHFRFGRRRLGVRGCGGGCSDRDVLTSILSGPVAGAIRSRGRVSDCERWNQRVVRWRRKNGAQVALF